MAGAPNFKQINSADKARDSERTVVTPLNLPRAERPLVPNTGSIAEMLADKKGRRVQLNLKPEARELATRIDLHVLVREINEFFEMIEKGELTEVTARLKKTELASKLLRAKTRKIQIANEYAESIRTEIDGAIAGLSKELDDYCSR